MVKETPPLIEEQHTNVTADNETSMNGFIKYLDMSKIPLCVSTYIVYFNFNFNKDLWFHFALLRWLHSTNKSIVNTYSITLLTKIKRTFVYRELVELGLLHNYKELNMHFFFLMSRSHSGYITYNCICFYLSNFS